MAKPDARFTRASIWHDQTGELYEIGDGCILIDDDEEIAVIDVSGTLAKRRGVPDDVSEFNLLASDNDTLVYEGKVVDQKSTANVKGLRLELHCDPPELIA